MDENKWGKKKHLKQYIAILLIVLLTACGTSKLEKQLDLGTKYLDELDYDSAIDAYNSAISIDSYNIDAYVGKAKAYEGKASVISDVEQELDLLYEAYSILAEITEENNGDYVGINESVDTASDYKDSLNKAFWDKATTYLEELNKSGNYDKIRELQDKYPYFEDAIGYYLLSYIDITLTGTYGGVSDDGSREIIDNVNDMQGGYIGGIILDTPLVFPNGSSTNFLLMLGSFSYDYEYGDAITITGTAQALESGLVDGPTAWDYTIVLGED